MIQLYDSLDELMNAKTEKQTDIELPEFPIPTEDITTTEQILDLIEFLKENKLDTVCSKYRKLVSAEEVIRDFNEMVGLEEPKKVMATQILSLCNRISKPRKQEPKKDIRKPQPQEPTERKESADATLLNTVIYGPPGCGKTTMARVLSQLYLKFGVIENGKIVHGDRANMIGEYVGDTAPKTKALLNSALGGVLFIDEAYQLGHAADGNRCPFAYECINTITQFITEHEGEIVIILAGYERDVKENFFAQNDGLTRRFPWSYTLTKATPEQLYEIFKSQMRKSKYSIKENALSVDLFKKKDLFNHSGGDTQILFDKCKMIHEKRMFSQLQTDTILTKVDIKKAFKLFEEQKEQETNRDSGPPEGLYT